MRNREVYGVLDLNIEKIVKEMNNMEKEDEYDWERERWKALNSKFWTTLQHKEGLLA